ncbi:MAG: hypothetical protein JRN20_03160 [Nitrososphaerota archaeon]|nr:hypothetical protein [Nitrososphaerota archaeon]MDG6922970.1 hypothetical protein [Nitrososphaerota archaeon]
MSVPDASQSLSQDFRRDVITKTVKDISEGRLIIHFEHRERRPEDIELISSTVGKLIGYFNDYVSGIKAGEELEFLEKQLFFCISVLRTYDVLKTNTNESIVEESLKRLESKTDTLALQLKELLEKEKPANTISPRKKSTRGKKRRAR